MQVGTKNQQLGVVGMNFQSLFDLQLALLQLTVNQVVLCLFVYLLYLGRYRLDKQLHLFIVFVYPVGIPKLLVPLPCLPQRPVQHPPQDQQVHVIFVNQNAVFDLAQSQFPLVDLKVGQSTFQILAKYHFFPYFPQYFLVEQRIPLSKGLKLSVFQDILHAPDRQQLQPLDLADTFDLLQGRGRVVQLVSPPVEQTSTRQIHHFLVNLCQLEQILGIFLQKDSLVVGLNCLPMFLLPFQLPRQFYFIDQTLVDNLVL